MGMKPSIQAFSDELTKIAAGPTVTKVVDFAKRHKWPLGAGAVGLWGGWHLKGASERAKRLYEINQQLSARR